MKKEEIDKIFQPDSNGFSDPVSVKNIPGWGNNGHSRHGKFLGDVYYLWYAERKNGNKVGKILTLQLVGIDKNNCNTNRPIRSDINEYYTRRCCVVCGSRSGVVTDHKNDLYNDPRVLNIQTQTFDDFQSLCTHCNLEKREVNKKTRKTGKRYGATNIPQIAIFNTDFTCGNEDFDPDDPNAMVGTYWHDPIDFLKKVTHHRWSTNLQYE